MAGFISANTTIVAAEAPSDLDESPAIVGSVVYDDDRLAKIITDELASGASLAIVVNGYTSAAYRKGPGEPAWLKLGMGELGDASANQIEAHLNSAQIFLHRVDSDLTDIAIDALPIKKIKKGAIKKWLKAVDENTGRTGGEVTLAVRQAVYADAAWRCQMCGHDLKKHILTGQRVNNGYCAHIVGASTKGPRGKNPLPLKQRNDKTNILLLCDGCHRLIDRVDLATYTVEYLREIRRENIKDVDRLLDMLIHSPARVIAVIGNISGQPQQFSVEDVYNVMHETQLRPISHDELKFLHFSSHQHKPHTAEYWGAVFSMLKSEIARCQAYLNGSSGAGSRERVAVFAVHGGSILLLAGKLFGETAGTHVFQKQWTDPAWRWLAGPGGEPDKFRLNILKDSDGKAREANLIVSLTYKVETNRLPADCWNGEYLRPTLEVFAEAPDASVLGRKGDLNALSEVLNAAIKKLQDEWKVETIHLFAGSPTSGLFKIGQKMQARHHAEFICYETTVDGERRFSPTIKIGRDRVEELISNKVIMIYEE